MNKVEKIRIKKFKVLEDFEHEFNGENYMIVGENGVGKTSLIQFLGIAFGDQKHIPPDCYGDGVVWIDKDGKNYVRSDDSWRKRSWENIPHPISWHSIRGPEAHPTGLLW